MLNHFTKFVVISILLVPTFSFAQSPHTEVVNLKCVRVYDEFIESHNELVVYYEMSLDDFEGVVPRNTRLYVDMPDEFKEDVHLVVINMYEWVNETDRVDNGNCYNRIGTKYPRVATLRSLNPVGRYEFEIFLNIKDVDTFKKIVKFGLMDKFLNVTVKK